MHDQDELHSEPSLHITSNMLDGGGDGISSGEWGVYNDAEVLDLQVGFVQGLKGAAVIKVMIEWDDKV